MRFCMIGRRLNYDDMEEEIAGLEEEIARLRAALEVNGVCPDCLGEIKIANPTGKCNHVHYPENKVKVRR